TGTFTLSFKGATTAPLALTVLPSAMQAALNALSTIGGAGGAVTVVQFGGAYTITFGGTLALYQQPLLVGANVNGNAAAAVTEQRAGNVVFTIAFQGGLLGVNLPPMTSTATGGTTAAVATTADGVPINSELFVGT